MSALAQLIKGPLRFKCHSAWEWWLGELGAMIPHLMRARFASKRRAVIRLRRDNVMIDRLENDGGESYLDPCAPENFAPENWAELDALTADADLRLVLAPPDIHCLELRLPKAARSRITSAISLQLYQRAPLDPAFLAWSHRIRSSNEHELLVDVVMARHSRIDQIQTMFEVQDLRVPPIDADTNFGLINLAAGEEQPRDPERQQIQRTLWASAWLILAIPFVIWIGASLLAATASCKIATLETQIAPKLEAERRWRAAERLKKKLAPVVNLPLASSAIEELARRLPQSDYAQSVEQDPDRTMLASLNVHDPKKAAEALANSAVLPRMMTVEQNAADGTGRTTITFKSAAR